MTWAPVAVAPPRPAPDTGPGTGPGTAPRDPDLQNGDPQDDGLRDEAVRVRLGAASTTPAAILLALARDPSVTVRTALVLNPATPSAALGVLAHDADERVRALLTRKLLALAPCLTEIEQLQLSQQAIEALGRLVGDTAVRVRAAIATVLKEMPNAPRELVLRLACDTEIEVSEPVIRLSPLLVQADLLSLLAASTAPLVALAVARRPQLTEDVADAIARTADVEAIRAMLLNHSAQIREATLDALISGAADHVVWHEPLVRRPNLSPRAARALSLIVADTLLAELVGRTDLTPAVATELRARLTARLKLLTTQDASRAHTSAAHAPAGHTPSDLRPSDQTPANPGPAAPVPVAPVPAAPVPAAPVPAASGPIDALAEARARAAAGGLTEADLIAVAGRGEARLAAAMLAVAAGVPLALVERAAFLRSAKGVVSLVWRAGFSMRLATPLQHLLGRLAPGSVLAAGPGGSFPLAIEEMRWQLELLGRGVPPASAPTIAAA